jgi:hypothetical protein
MPIGRAVWSFSASFEAFTARLDVPALPPFSWIERTPSARAVSSS